MKKREKKNSEKLSLLEYGKLLQREKNWKETMPRPSISHDKYAENYERIFGKKEDKK